MFDWANSVYPLVILSTIFPAYYSDMAVQVGEDEIILFGQQLKNTFVLDVVLSLACLIVAFMNPVLSGIADASGKKLTYLKRFNLIGVVGCLSLFFFDNEHIWVGLFGAFVASIGYSGSLVFYNAYLPEIVDEEDQDRISAKGFSYGYLGSALYLILVLITTFYLSSNYQDYEFLPQDSTIVKHEIFRWSFIGLGIWWLGFARITFNRLPSNVYKKKISKDMLSAGLKELKQVYSSLKTMPELKRFLCSFAIFSLAVQTMILVAAFFGKKEINFPKESVDAYLIIMVLIIQFVGMLGAWFFARLSKKKGNVASLTFGLISYLIACIIAFIVTEPTPFMCLAALVGFGMGGIQAMARSTYSKLLPQTEDHASYFSFFDFVEKMSIVFGLLLYGTLEQITGSQRMSVLVLTFVFLIALVIIYPLRKSDKLKGENQ